MSVEYGITYVMTGALLAGLGILLTGSTPVGSGFRVVFALITAAGPTFALIGAIPIAAKIIRREKK